MIQILLHCIFSRIQQICKFKSPRTNVLAKLSRILLFHAFQDALLCCRFNCHLTTSNSYIFKRNLNLLKCLLKRRARVDIYLNLTIFCSCRRFCVWSYISEHRGRLVLLNMVLESILSSPHRRHPPFRKQFPANELGSWSTLFNRHRFLLTALALLTLLCTIYLYFAITLGAAVSSCSGLTGAQKELCRLEHAEASLGKGKFKFL